MAAKKVNNPVKEKERAAISYANAQRNFESAKVQFLNSQKDFNIHFLNDIENTLPSTKRVIFDTKNVVVMVNKGKIGKCLDQELLVINIMKFFNVSQVIAEAFIDSCMKKRKESTSVISMVK